MLDGLGVSCVVIESLVENYFDGVVVFVFWYVFFGLLGIFVYKMVNMVDLMIGYKLEKYFYFGWVLVRWDDFVNLILVWLLVIFIVLGVWIVESVVVMWCLLCIVCVDYGKYCLLNLGWLEVVMVGVIDL